MKESKLKRILAIIGVIILASLYLITFLAAIFDSGQTLSLFKGCVATTIFVPVVLYAYILMYRFVKRLGDESKAASATKSEEETPNSDGSSVES